MASIAARAVLLAFLFSVSARSCAAAPSPSLPGNISKYTLLFFGDSLTDSGNDFKAAGVPAAKLYLNGRFCNGFNWADALRISVAKTVPLQFANYAYGGATACANPTYEKLYPFVKNLTSQVAAFAEDIQKNKIRLANTSTLALQYIGSEDVMFFFRSAAEANATVTPEALAALVSRVVTCRVQGTAALAAIPGVTSIGILPISPLHLAPAVPEVMKPQLLAVQALFANATAAAMADLNAQLAAAGSTVKVYVLGPSSWIANVVNRIYPSFAFLDEPCFWYPGSMLNLTAAAGMRSCKAPQNFLFYDQLHPTTRFHDWFATKTLLPRLQTLGLLP